MLRAPASSTSAAIAASRAGSMPFTTAQACSGTPYCSNTAAIVATPEGPSIAPGTRSYVDIQSVPSCVFTIAASPSCPSVAAMSFAWPSSVNCHTQTPWRSGSAVGACASRRRMAGEHCVLASVSAAAPASAALVARNCRLLTARPVVFSTACGSG